MGYLDFDTDCVEYHLEYLREVQQGGMVRCCGHDWRDQKLIEHEGQTVRVMVRSRLEGRYVSVGTLNDEFICIADCVA